MQFKVPQFLDIEDKIFGPFTIKQFVYLAGGTGSCFIIYKLLGFIIGAIPIILIGGFSLALAFYRPNNKPLITMLEAGIKYLIQDKLYIWKKSKPRIDDKRGNGTGVMPPHLAKLTGSKLKDLAWSLDVLDLSKNKGG